MNAEERAKQILIRCLAIRGELLPPHVVSEVAEQIKQAEQAAYEKGLEDAAKVAEVSWEKDRAKGPKIAERIRALKHK